MKKTIIILGFLILLVIGGRAFWAYQKVASETTFVAPGFSPTKEWSIKFTNLFKQAIKEKYNLDNTTLANNLFIIAVSNGAETDGAVLSPGSKGQAIISYLYKIQWAYVSGSESRYAVRFETEDGNGAMLSDDKIVENIKKNLSPIFSVRNIISGKEVTSLCRTPDINKLSPVLNPPFYNNADNNINFDTSRNDLFFQCYQTVNYSQNHCQQIVFSLTTGNELINREVACHTTPATLPR